MIISCMASGFCADQACSHAWDDFAVAKRRVKCSQHCCTQVLTFWLILCRKPSRRTSSSAGTQEVPRPAAAQGWLLLHGIGTVLCTSGCSKLPCTACCKAACLLHCLLAHAASFGSA